MKISKSILLVLVIIFFTVTLIIPVLTGKSLGSIVEPFTSTGGLYNIKVGPKNSKYCLFKDSVDGGSLINNKMIIDYCDGSGKNGTTVGKKNPTSNPVNAQWKITKNAYGSQNIRVGTDPSYCLNPATGYGNSITGIDTTTDKCIGGTAYGKDPRNASWSIDDTVPGDTRIKYGKDNSLYCLYPNTALGNSVLGVNTAIELCDKGSGVGANPLNAKWSIVPIPTKHPPSHSQAMGYSETELSNQTSNPPPAHLAGVADHLHREEGKRNPNGDDCRNLGLTHCMTNSNCDNDSYCAKKCVEGTCDGKSMHHSDKHKHKHKHKHKLGPGGTQHLLGPGGTHHPKHHKAHHSGHQVPDNMQDHKYKKFISDGLDHNSLNREKYERIGKNFMKDEARSKGVNMPPIHDSEAEILGKMVWRVYAAEMEEKRTRSQKAKDSVMDKEIQLLSKVSQIMKNETDHHKGKKHQGLGCQASDVPNNSPKYYYSQRTDNMFGYSPSNANDVKREEGHAFEGHPVTGMPRYFDQTNAIEHCFRDHRCGGVNYDSTTGEYSIMPQHAKLVKRHHYTAFIKKDKQQCKSQNKQRNKQHPGAPNSPYQPVTGIGTPRDPNLLPRAYNSLMDLF